MFLLLKDGDADRLERFFFFFFSSDISIREARLRFH